MPETLPTFLKKRAERSYRYLLEQAEAVTEAEALRGANTHWPNHVWGVGQNGSIAGIVYHVAAWKQMTLPLFAPDGEALTMETFDFDSAPSLNDWRDILAWFKQVGTAWNAELMALSDADFDAVRRWDGTELTLAKLVVEIYEHDIQHAAQLEYLRQLHRAEGGLKKNV